MRPDRKGYSPTGADHPQRSPDKSERPDGATSDAKILSFTGIHNFRLLIESKIREIQKAATQLRRDEDQNDADQRLVQRGVLNDELPRLRQKIREADPSDREHYMKMLSRRQEIELELISLRAKGIWLDAPARLQDYVKVISGKKSLTAQE